MVTAVATIITVDTAGTTVQDTITITITTDMEAVTSKVDIRTSIARMVGFIVKASTVTRPFDPTVTTTTTVVDILESVAVALVCISAFNQTLSKTNARRLTVGGPPHPTHGADLENRGPAPNAAYFVGRRRGNGSRSRQTVDLPAPLGPTKPILPPRARRT